ncbi:unnamed protein product [Heterobilharzia americana]|nr:unnamed protein product [Heterobilharzia americana]
MQEPIHLLTPVQPRYISQNNCTTSYSIGLCTCILPVDDCHLVSGHTNGWIVIWSVESHRPYRQWIGHANHQLISLHFWPSDNSNVIISHARDGFIRFWDFSQFQVNDARLFDPLIQVFSEIRTYGVAFCNSSLWSASVNSQSGLHFLAHLCEEEKEDDASKSVKELVIEVIQLPQFTFICHQSIDGLQRFCKNISNLGMCMALQGVEKSFTEEKAHYLLLAGFESGHLILLGDGLVLTILDFPLGQSIPIMKVSIRPAAAVVLQQLCEEKTDLPPSNIRLVALGGPVVDTCDTKLSTDGSLAFIQLEFNVQLQNPYKLLKVKKIISDSNVGVSCFTWRDDGRLLAVGQWNGQIRLFQVQLKSSKLFKIKSLGYLTSVGGLNEGSLIGEWCATTLNNSSGSNMNQDDKLIRSCTFTKGSDF